jgi:hypothetical protein
MELSRPLATNGARAQTTYDAVGVKVIVVTCTQACRTAAPIGL